MSKLWDNLTQLDVFLLAAGLLAALLYATVLPRFSPDAGAERSLSAEEIIDVGRSFISARGGTADDLVPHVEFRREAGLLRAMQAGGRSGVAGTLERTGLPAYSFDLQFRRIETSGSSIDMTDRYFLKLTPSGKVWHFVDKDAADTGDREPADEQAQALVVDRAALWSTLSQDSTYAANLATILSWDDSTLVRRLRFDFRTFIEPRAVTRNGTEFRPPPVPTINRGGGVRNEQTIWLTTEHVVTLARRYLEPSSFTSSSFDVDSLWLQQGRLAGVRFVSRDDSAGVIEQVDVTVTPVGGLHELEHEFIPANPDSLPTNSTIQSLVKVGLYFLLSIILLFVFFRQLIARAIDVRAALIDCVVFSVAFVLFALLTVNLYAPGMPTWVRFLGIGAALGIGGGVMALIAFLSSAAGDSLVRRSMVRKLVNTSLIRQGSILNGFVGSAILKGVAIGFVALAVSASMLAIFFDAPIEYTSSSFVGSFIQPATAAVGFSIWSAYFKTILLVIVVSALVYKQGRPGWVVVLPIAIAFALTDGAATSFTSPLLTWAAGLAVGLVFGLAFWYFDILVCFVGLTVFALFSSLQEGWLIEGSPFIVDVVIAVLVVAGVMALGFVGVSRGRPSGAKLEYVPQYIKELGLQQQLQRELQIARQVQESFLPKTMPTFHGVDIAATCIPAEQVGGDYYDFVSLSSDRLGVALGDVSGKGIQAAFFMTLTKGFLRSACRETASPASVLDKINSLFRDSAPRGTFISLVYGVVDSTNSTFTFGRAGHNPIILKRAGSEKAELIQPSGLGIGLASKAMFASAMTEETISLYPGDVLAIFTDGFSEARSTTEGEYGDERLADIVCKNATRSAGEIVDAVCDDVVKFCGSESTHDDRTIMVIRVGTTESSRTVAS